MNKDLLKKTGLVAGIVVFFLILAYSFVPQVLQGKIVDQSDISGYVGMSNEMAQWNKAHPDDPAYWTDSMFGGMPTTSISKMDQGDWTQKIYDFLLIGKRPATWLFIALLGGFLLLMAFGVKWYVAVIGAIAMAFCSYNFQIIQVGHNTKMQAIAFFPWVLAALVFTYRSAFREGRYLPRTLLGAVLFALALSMQVKANHQQITYYLALVIFFYALVLLVDVLWKHRDRTARFFIASALLLGIGGIGIATNTSKLLPLYKYQAHTMRGGSELSGEGGVKGGLDLEYATAWSYGWEELPNLMIPDFNGGSSVGAVNPDRSETIRVLRKYGQVGNLREIAKGLPMYWGPQPFTAGPMYMGAITVFLFVLGLCLYKGKEKWWLLIATLFAVLLALGNHFMAFTRFCFKVLPLYSKFRTVSMALITLQYTLPLLGFLVLDKALRGEYKKEEFFKGSLVAFLVTGGFCLLCWLIPGIAGSFSAASDAQQQAVLAEAFRADRRMLLRHDALVGFLLILATWGALLVAQQPKWANRKGWLAGGIGLLVLVSMFSIGKRYLNADHFTTPRNFTAQFAERPVDALILEDEDPSYRVLDLTVNVFNDAHPSYRHKNVGGYSPAKLQRYQDLIDHYLGSEINTLYRAMRGASTVSEIEASLPSTPWLDALNTRYIIVGGDNPPVVNRKALGPAWFVSSVAKAAVPDEEILLAGEVSLRDVAVIGPDFAGQTPDPVGGDDAVIPGSTGNLVLSSYSPNELVYEYNTPEDALAVFSEIYYPGWNAWLDGDRSQAVEVLRVDWTLRAAMLPVGSHTLTMRFEPSSYRVGANVSRASSILLILLLLAAVAGMFLPSSGSPSKKTAENLDGTQ